MVSIAGAAPKGSTVTITFNYEVVDVYPAQEQRARVYSSSDRQGEWVAIREVSIKDGVTPAASHWYRGEVVISDDEASKASGDGKIFVRTRSWLSIAYYDKGAASMPIVEGTPTTTETAHVSLNLPTPTATPAPIPAVNPALLVVAVGAGALVVLLRRGRVVPSGG